MLFRSDCSSPDSSVHGILQARILERVVIPFSKDLPDPGTEPRSSALQADSLLSGSLQKPCYHCHVQLFENPWTVARQAPLTMEFSRQEYWSELPIIKPGRNLFWLHLRHNLSHAFPKSRVSWLIQTVYSLDQKSHWSLLALST